MKRTSLKRILSAALVLMMVLALAAPAFADDEVTTYTVTIEANQYTQGGKDQRFEAYQIFKGTLDNFSGGTGTQNPPLSNKLANVQWGDDVTGSAIETSLRTDGTTTLESLGINLNNLPDKYKGSYTTVGDLFSALLKNGAITGDEAAQIIADALSDINKTAFTKYFAGVAETATAGHDPSGKSSWTGSAGEGDYGHWTIGGLVPGYYLILDTETNVNNPEAGHNADSSRIMGVFGNETIAVKSDAPTSSKNIKDGSHSSDTDKGDAAGVGDTVTFELHGTLPDNYDDYTKYIYRFIDQLSTGLTYKGNMRVYVDVPNLTEEGTKGTGSVRYEIKMTGDDTGYKLTVTPEDGKAAKITIEFADLLHLTGTTNTTKPEGEDNRSYVKVPVNRYTTFTIEYDVTLNTDAVVVAPDEEGVWSPDNRNKNGVKLEYSNDPRNDQEMGTTPDDEVYVYDFGLDITKKNNQNANLNGAGFVIADSTKTKYAILQKTGTDPTEYTVVGWVTASDVETFFSTGAGKDLQDGWANKLPNSTAIGSGYTTPATGDFYFAPKTANDGNSDGKLHIKGLDEGTYTLTEKVVPPGYNKIDDFTIEIKATINDDKTPGALVGLEAKDVSNRSDVIVGGETDDDDFVDIEDTGMIPLEILNTPASNLPGTGGIGTTIFRVAGIVLLLGAATLLVLSGRKKADK